MAMNKQCWCLTLRWAAWSPASSLALVITDFKSGEIYQLSLFSEAVSLHHARDSDGNK